MAVFRASVRLLSVFKFEVDDQRDLRKRGDISENDRFAGQ